ncbi:LysR family transcriptional regulator [Alcaligenes sp. HPC1271]|nr:LysR family transcriptional regulator [Alcaligenes sp. HPC1271]EKU28413.1 LysR family transcriptional regulator [Alcaligenes sp. HPC1271]
MRIPVPLNALRTFEAAARHLSIKDAALELAVTPSAVSHQLRTLEDLLGVELLRRVGATVELTDAGRRLAPTLNAGFCHIAASVQALRDERLDGPLRLHTLPAIAINWLAPRLAAYPFGTAESALDITTVQGHADLAAGTADVGLWFGEPPWPGLASEMLFAGTLASMPGPARWPPPPGDDWRNWRRRTCSFPAMACTGSNGCRRCRPVRNTLP